MCFILFSIFTSLLRAGEVDVMKPAPEFTLRGADSLEYSLNQFRGKYVVLEWVNYGCPFVQKHYNSSNMQKLQAEMTGKGVIWFSVCSSAKGDQGNFDAKTIQKLKLEKSAAYSAYLIDEDGKVGRIYGAKTTPHMFIIDPKGQVIYGGAIDNIRSTKIADLDKAENYVRTILDSAMEGKPFEAKLTEPYGCSIKYR